MFQVKIFENVIKIFKVFVFFECVLKCMFVGLFAILGLVEINSIFVRKIDFYFHNDFKKIFSLKNIKKVQKSATSTTMCESLTIYPTQ